MPASRSSRCPRHGPGPDEPQRACTRASRCRCRRTGTRTPTTCSRPRRKDSTPALARRAGQHLRSAQPRCRSCVRWPRFGGHGVLIPQRRSASVTAVAWRTSAGAAARLPVARATNLTRTLKSWHDAGLQVVGLDADGDTTLDDLDGTGTDGCRGRLRGQGLVATGSGELRRGGVHPDGRTDRIAQRLGGRRCGAGRDRAPAKGLTRRVTPRPHQGELVDR